jgi:antitoxin component YwqK of YwqJK toxin-antitoxin module
MKKIITLILLALFISSTLSAQKLSLTDLSTLCNKKNWQDVNQFMLVKGWTYYDSKKGDSDNYNTITWSYNKEDYSDKAQAWFYLYTFDEYPNKISYSIFNKTSYLLIQNSLTANGFKVVSSEIEDEKVISTYANSGYKLIITNAKRNDNDWSDRSFVSYNVTLIKKAGIYDDANGKKTDYYNDGTIKSEYSLVNGKINGAVKFYDENGTIKKTASFSNGSMSGKVIEYNEDSSIGADYYLVNGKVNGLFNSYFYNDSSKMLSLKEFGQYIDDEKNGVWKINIMDDKIEKTLFYTNYIKGIKEGDFQEVKGDTLIVGSYKSGKLHGSYKAFLDPIKSLFGGTINTKTADLTLVQEGQYNNGKKSGYWKNFDISASLTAEGNYSDDEESGEWKFYTPNYVKENGEPEPFAKKLETKATYLNGKLNGKYEQFYLREEVQYPCDKVDDDGNKIDGCSKIKFSKIHLLSYYKDDELNGVYEIRDSINQIVLKGQYEDDLKEGKWFSYRQGNKINKETNYKYGLLDGEYIEFNDNGKPVGIKQFENNKLKQAALYNNISLDKKYQVDVIQRTANFLKVKKTTFVDSGIVSQVYWLKNDIKNEESFDLDFLLLTKNDVHLDIVYPDGEYLLATLNNEPIVSGKFYKNYKEDTWTYYYYEQKVKIEEKYSSNTVIDEVYLNLDSTLFSGEFEFLDTDKNIKEVRKIKNGLRNGKTSFIDIATNKTINKENYKEGKLKV